MHIRIEERGIRPGAERPVAVSKQYQNQTDFNHPELDVECTVHKGLDDKWHGSINNYTISNGYCGEDFKTRDEAIAGIINELISGYNRAQNNEDKLYAIREALKP